jgi:hypothetical protein
MEQGLSIKKKEFKFRFVETTTQGGYTQCNGFVLPLADCSFFDKSFFAADFKSAAILARNYVTYLRSNIGKKNDGTPFLPIATPYGTYIPLRYGAGIQDFEMTT